VTLEVSREAGAWVAAITPPDALQVMRLGPTDLETLIRQLQQAGCHTTDISDAIFAADREEWKRIFDPKGKYRKYYENH
jgi:hypothetical protein